MTHPDFTCACGRLVDVVRRAGNGPLLWHYCAFGGASDITARDEAELLALWTAERQRKAAA